MSTELLLPEVLYSEQTTTMESRNDQESSFIINDRPEDPFEGLEAIEQGDLFAAVNNMSLETTLSQGLLSNNIDSSLYSAPFTSLAVPIPIKDSAFDPEGLNIIPPIGGPMIQPPLEMKPVPLAAFTQPTDTPKAQASHARLDSGQLLLEAFKRQPRPNKKQIKALATTVGLSAEEVAAFFAKRRQETEQVEKEAGGAGTPKKAAKAKSSGPALEEHLRHILDDKGGISDAKHSSRLVKIMAAEKNVDSKSLLVHIIISTQKAPIKKTLLQAGVLRVLHPWLVTAVKDGPVTFLIQILKVIFCS